MRKDIIEIAYSINIDYLVFSDFDDTYAENRITEVYSSIESFDCAFNDFFIVDSSLDKIYKDSFYNLSNCNTSLSSVSQLLNKNYIGLGSMALNLRKFPYDKVKLPKYVRAFDWFLVSYVLLKGGTCSFLKNTYANYRQHNDSYVGSVNELDEDKLSHGIDVKLAHYKAFASSCSIFNELLSDMVALKKYLNAHGTDDYISRVNKIFMNKFPCWWENILTLDELNEAY